MERKIILKEIRMKNFKCYKDKTITFDKPVVTISGKNGTGKSTVAEAYMWALFDADYEGKSNPNVRHRENGEPVGDGENVAVCVTFNIDGIERQYARVQTRKHDIESDAYADSNTYVIDDVKKTKSAFQSEVSWLKPFSNINYFFATNSLPAARQLLFEKCGVNIASIIENNPKYSDVCKLIKFMPVADIASKYKSVVKNASRSLDENNKKIESLKAEADELEAWQKQLAENETKQKACVGTVEYIGQMKKKMVELEEEAKEKRTNVMKNAPTPADIAKLEAKCEFAKKVVEQYASMGAGAVCISCGQAIPKEYAESKLKNANAELNSAETELKSANAKYLTAVDVCKQIDTEYSKAIEDLQVKMENAVAETFDVDELIRENVELACKLTVAQKALKAIEACRANIKNLASEYANAKKILSQLEDADTEANQTAAKKLKDYFSVVEWQLQDAGKNGERTNTCVPTVGGMSILTTASNKSNRIMGKIDVCLGLQKLLDVNAPIWIDDAESLDAENVDKVKNLADGRQIIMVRVTDSEFSIN